VANTRFIGIGHQARSGKDTFAWMLLDELRQRGIDARRYGFADALKAVCRVEYGMVGKDARMLQQVGVEYRLGRRAGKALVSYVANTYDKGVTTVSAIPTPTVWIDACFDAIREDAPVVAIIPDTRFTNEAEAIKLGGGLIIKVDRPNRPSSGRDDSHPSETELLTWPFDHIILNDGDLDTLRTKARRLAAILV